MKYRIAISGSYGGMNLGDEAILEGILKELKASDFETDIVVFSYDPKDTEKRHNVRAIAIRELHKDEIIKEIKELDLFILGGGGFLFDGKAEDFLRDVIWAQELNVPIMVYAMSIGPLKNYDTRQHVVQVLNKADVITVRESESKRLLNDFGVTIPVEVTADPAFLIKPQGFTKEMLKKEGIDPEINFVGFSVREPGMAAPDLNIDHYHTILANAADFMIDRFETQILFIPMESGTNRDPQHSHAVISKMFNANKASVLKGNYSSGQILGLMEHMVFAVGMRLHFLIFASLQNVPFIPLPYSSKVKGLIDDLELQFPLLEETNSGKLCAAIDRAWDTRKRIKQKLEEKIPELQKRSKVTNKILCDLLKKITPKKGK